ncbi:MAG: hypothetical protein ACYCSO_03305 [Cuniculiplasma sp.]
MTDSHSSRTPRIVVTKKGIRGGLENSGNSEKDISFIRRTPATVATIKVGEMTEASIIPV